MFMSAEPEDDQFNPYQRSPRSRSPFGPSGLFPPTLFQRLANTLWRYASHILLLFAYKLEWFHANVYAMLCFMFGLKSRPMPSTDRTAICVMGSDDGVGRMVALKFAEAGYTVFGCLPHDVHTPRGTGYSSAISPLLYIWQARKARARSIDDDRHIGSMLGSIVPLVFDPSIPDDCERAVETIRAYCDRHALHLSTIILPPLRPATSSSSPGHYESGSASGSIKNFYAGGFGISGLLTTNPSTLHDAIASTITQPLSMIQALLSTLRDAEGQIIFLSGGIKGVSPLMALSDAARQSAALSLASELAPLGIHVSLVIANTSSSSPTSPEFVNPYSQAYDEDDEKPLGGRRGVVSWRGMLHAVLSMWEINDESYFGLIRGVLESRYPRPTYRFGLDTIALQLISASVPDSVTFIAQHIVRTIFGSKSYSG